MSLNVAIHPQITLINVSQLSHLFYWDRVSPYNLTCPQYVFEWSLVSAAWWLSGKRQLIIWRVLWCPPVGGYVFVCACVCVCVCTICVTVSWIDPVLTLRHLTSRADTFTAEWCCVWCDEHVWSKGFPSHNMVSFKGKRCNTFPGHWNIVWSCGYEVSAGTRFPTLVYRYLFPVCRFALV